MRLTKEQDVRATNELLAMLARNRQSGGFGLRTSEMAGTPEFHGAKTLSLRQIARLLRKTGKVIGEPCGSGTYTYNEWRLTNEAWDQACGDRSSFFLERRRGEVSSGIVRAAVAETS